MGGFLSPPVQMTDIGIRLMRPQLGYATIKQVGNLEKAIANAREFTAEVVAMLRGESAPKADEKEEVMAHGG